MGRTLFATAHRRIPPPARGQALRNQSDSGLRLLDSAAPFTASSLGPLGSGPIALGTADRCRSYILVALTMLIRREPE